MTEETTLAAPTSDPQVRVTIKCRIGLHSWVDLPKPKNKMARLFIVRRIRGCVRCGVVFTDRFKNCLGGGRAIRCGYLDPKDIQQRSTQGV